MKIPLGKVTPIYKGAYAAAAEYLVNDIVLHTNGNLYWHVSATPTTGVAPTDGTVWAVAFSGADVKAAIEGFVTAAEGWANGTHDGDPVGSSDPAYHNNAAWWNEKAAEQASAAAGAKTGAESARDASAEWATGGTSGTPSAANNAKKYAEDAAAAQTAAESARDAAEQWATGETGGTPGANNNAKYYSEQAAASAAAAAANSGLAPAFDPDTPYAVGEYVLYSGKVYRFTAAHTGAWDAADVEQTTLGEEVTDLDASKADKTDVATADAALTQMILASFPTDSITDAAVASFADGADGIPVKAMTVNITPAQDGSGDPSPTNVRPISGWTGATVTDDGGNLLDGVTWTSGYYIDADGTVTPIASGQYCDYMPVDASKPYALDSNGVAVGGGNYRVHAYDAEKNWIAQAAISSPSSSAPLVLAVTLPAGSKYVRLSIPYGASYDTSDYIFHAKRSYTVSWQSVAGTVYGGTLTWLGDDQWKLAVLYGGVDMGDLSYTYDSNGYFKATIDGKKAQTGDANKCRMLSIGVDVGDMSASSFALYPDGTISSRNSSANFWLRWSATTDKDVVKAAVAGQTIVYELATPIEYTLTAESVRTLLGQNNIFADCGNIVELTYCVDVGLYIDKKLAEA